VPSPATDVVVVVVVDEVVVVGAAVVGGEVAASAEPVWPAPQALISRRGDIALEQGDRGGPVRVRLPRCGCR
jgi:hypothetical protein